MAEQTNIDKSIGKAISRFHPIIRMANSMSHLFLVIVSCSLLTSCDKKNHPKDSIAGTWRCYEELRNITPYNISIEFTSDDSSQIIIRNLYNTGFDVETYASYIDTLITFIYTESMVGHDFIGTGHVSRDLTSIFWAYNYYGPSGSNPYVEVYSIRP